MVQISKNKQKRLKTKKKKQVAALKDLELQDQQNQLNEFFQNAVKVMKIKVNCKKIKDMKIKSSETIRFINRATRYMDL